MGDIYAFKLIPLISLSAIILAFSSNTILAAVRLQSSAPIHVIREGEFLAFHCKIWNLQTSHHSVIISRQTEDVESETLSWHGAILADVDERFFLAVRNQADGSVVYFLVVMDVSRRDSGRYVCQILDKSGGGYVAEESVMIEVNYLPSSSNPHCTPKDDFTVSSGGMAIFNCTSETGKPSVSFQWSRVRDDNVITSDYEFTNGKTAYSEMILNVKQGDAGAVFLCTITSEAFPSYRKTCFIGPLVIEESSSGEEGGRPSSEFTTPPSGGSTNVSPEHCRINECPFFAPKALFWMTAFGTAALLVIGLLVWIVCMYRKVHRLRRTPPKFSRPPPLPLRGEEDFYVEMSNKRARDDDRTYMTLERPRVEYMAYPIVRHIEEDTLSLETGESVAGSSGFAQPVLKANI